MINSLGMIGPLGMWELLLILAVALIIFGPGKLPDVGKALGRGINEFKNASQALHKDISSDASSEKKEEKEEKKEV